MAMISAPYPVNCESKSESVADYNRVHGGKAWAIVGMTWQGDVYCVRDSCAGTWPTYENDLPIDSPYPMFGTDDYRELTCGNCGGDLYRNLI